MEYNRTHNNIIGKARFPSLLKQLWETDAIQTKNNIIKSFMKAGVFPLNSKSIDHSRILQNTTAAMTTPSNDNDNNNNNNLVQLIVLWLLRNRRFLRLHLRTML
jgi:hypothetical protein